MYRSSIAGVTIATLMMWSRFGYAESISLAAALDRAANRPTIVVAEADQAAARAIAQAARRPLYNPEVSIGAGPRFVAGDRSLTLQAGIAQTIELGGKRAARATAADARIAVADAALEDARVAARIEAWRAYELAVVAHAQRDAAIEVEQLAADVVKAVSSSKSAGGDTQLSVNLALADLGRARHARLDADNTYSAAVAALATVIGAGASESLEPDATGVEIPELGLPLKDAIARANRRPDLVAIRSEIAAAQADLHSAERAAVPDITLSLGYAFEPDPGQRTHALLVGAAIALPFRSHNELARSTARAEVHRATLVASSAEIEVERAVQLAYARDARARDAFTSFDREVIGRFHENLVLARESLRAGKIDFFAYSVARRELSASRVDYLNALAEAIEARAEFARAVGVEVGP